MYASANPLTLHSLRRGHGASKIYAIPFASVFRNFAISSCDGGQFASQVLQWNSSTPDFRASSNPSWLKVTVWLWPFGQTISKSTFLLMFPDDSALNLNLGRLRYP